MSNYSDDNQLEIETGHLTGVEEFIEFCTIRLRALFKYALKGDSEALATLGAIHWGIKNAFAIAAPVPVQRALEVRNLMYYLAEVVKPTVSNKTGSVFDGYIKIDGRCTNHIFQEANECKSRSMPLQSLARRVFNKRLLNRGLDELDNRQFDRDAQEFHEWEDLPPRPSSLYHCIPVKDDLGWPQRFEPIQAVHSVKQTWTSRKRDKRRG